MPDAIRGVDPRLPALRGGSVSVETITDPEVLTALRGEWRDLLQASSADCVFLTWQWLSTWWRHLSQGRRLCLIAVRSAGELIAVAPFMVAPPRVTRLIPFRSLVF